MRAAFFSLLFANLAFLAWGQWIDVPLPMPANEAYARLPRLKLVNELPPEATRPSSASARRTALKVSPSAAPTCLSVGPFGDLASATQGAAQLREKGLAPAQRSEEGQVSKGFWVFIGGLTSNAEVSHVLLVLEQASIQDAHLMPESGEPRKISVGLFSDRQRAERRAQAVQKLGLQSEVGERKVPGTVFWEDVTVPGGTTSLPAGALAAEGTGASPEVVPCPAGSPPPDGPPKAPSPLPTKIAGASKVP